MVFARTSSILKGVSEIKTMEETEGKGVVESAKFRSWLCVFERIGLFLHQSTGKSGGICLRGLFMKMSVVAHRRYLAAFKGLVDGINFFFNVVLRV